MQIALVALDCGRVGHQEMATTETSEMLVAHSLSTPISTTY